MAQRPEPINAIAYAQFCLRGGVKQTLGIMIAAFLVIGLIAALVFSANPTTVRDSARSGVGLLLGAQTLIMTVFGTLRINVAVRQDVAGGLIESHRMTPNAPLSAVLGYAFGAPVQALVLGVVVFFCGLVLCLIGGFPLPVWLVANVMVMASASVLWSFVVLASFAASQPGMVPAVAGLILPAAGLVPIVPALSVISSPVAGRSMWQIQGIGTLPVAYAFTLAGDALFIGLFLLAAARKYRSATLDAFNMRLAGLLLLVWMALTAIGLALPDVFLGIANASRNDEAVRLIAAVLSGLLLAFIPTAAAARASVVPIEMFVGNRVPWWRGDAWVGIPLCALLVCSVTLLTSPHEWTDLWQRQLGTFAVATILLVSVGCLIARADLAGRGGWIGVVIWVALGNLLPLLAQLAHDSRDLTSNATSQILLTIGPVASLIALWGDYRSEVWVGVGVQAALALIPAGLLIARIAKQRRPAPPAGQSPRTHAGGSNAS